MRPGRSRSPRIRQKKKKKGSTQKMQGPFTVGLGAVNSANAKLHQWMKTDEGTNAKLTPAARKQRRKHEKAHQTMG